MKQLWELLGLLEDDNSYSGKEVILRKIIQETENGEDFLRLAFNDSVYGLKEKSFMKAFDIDNLGEFNHISSYLAEYNLPQDLDEGRTRNFTRWEDIISLSEKMLEKSGYDQLAELKAYFIEFTHIERKWICRMLLHDLRCGVKVKTVNKVLIYLGKSPIEKFALQLCETIENIYDETEVEKYIRFPCAVETKYDGIRIQAEVKDGKCKLTSRRGKDRSGDYPEIVQELERIFPNDHIILDGEMIARSFQALTRKDDVSERYYVIFDCIIDETETYKERYERLVNLYNFLQINHSKNIVLAINSEAKDIKDLQRAYENANRDKEEGIIIKLYDRPYERGSRKHMFKVKKSYTADLKIIGWKLGDGKRHEKVATLELQDASGLRVDVGSGIDDMVCDYFTQEVINSPLEGKPSFIGKIVEILYNEKTETGSLRFPRFVRVRDDKTEPDDLSNVDVRQGEENQEAD